MVSVSCSKLVVFSSIGSFFPRLVWRRVFQASVVSGVLFRKNKKDAKAGIIPSSGVLRSSLLFHFELRQIAGDLLPHEDCGPPLPPALAAVYRRPIQDRVSRHLLDTLMAFGAGVPSMYYHWPNHPYSMPPQRER